MLPKQRIRRRPKRYTDSDIKESATPFASLEKRLCGSPNNTIESSVSVPFEANTWQDVREKLESITWVQCDNPGCLKWRKVPNDHAAGLTQSDKWMCRLNPDPQFNKCEAPEEDVAAYDQLAIRSGLRYFKSELPPGALVWARMHGYCSWPAVVTPDPGTDNGHAWRDEEEEEEVMQYHVEFLGQPHSHAWVSARQVDTFTASSAMDPSQAVHTAASGGKGLRKCRQKSSQQRTTYRSGSCVQQAVSEALRLLPLSPAKRLQTCVYMSCHSSIQRTSPVCASNPQPTAVNTDYTLGKAATSGKRGRGRPAKRTSVEGQAPEPSTSPCYTAFTSSLEGRSKEERLMLDVEMYRRNERAFEHDVTRFLLRNGLKVCSKGPVWHNQSVSLFQIFLAVHERGGYSQVTQHRGWASVYREVTNMCQSDIHKSQSAKDFYRRYLYPYELYIRGEDFKSCNTDSVAKQKKLQRGKKQKQKGGQTAYSRLQAVDSKTEEEDDIMSDSLREMLQALEENSKLAMEEDAGIDITFYDDSTPNSKDCTVPLILFENQDPPPQIVPTAVASNTIQELSKVTMAADKATISATTIITTPCLQELQNAKTLGIENITHCTQQDKHHIPRTQGCDNQGGLQMELARKRTVEAAFLVDTSLHVSQHSSHFDPAAGCDERRLSDSNSSFSQLLDQLNTLQEGIDFSEFHMG